MFEHNMPQQQHYETATYTLHSSVAFLIKRSQTLWRGLIEPALSAKGFTYLQYVILALLRGNMAVNPKDISREFHHNGGALTRVFDQLCERGLLERDRSVRDRRKVDLQLTTAGRDRHTQQQPRQFQRHRHEGACTPAYDVLHQFGSRTRGHMRCVQAKRQRAPTSPSDALI
jgi:DNA-binding MarR family transcriptional regulator